MRSSQAHGFERRPCHRRLAPDDSERTECSVVVSSFPKPLRQCGLGLGVAVIVAHRSRINDDPHGIERWLGEDLRMI